MIDKIFDQLDKWRHFPSYQLERRADIFFALLMERILGIKNVDDVRGRIIPEFPIRIGTVYPKLPDKFKEKKNPKSNQSYKIDYVVFNGQNEVILVELKTDAGSRNDLQDGYLYASQRTDFKDILSGLIKIYEVTKRKSYKRKYEAILNELVDFQVLSKTENRKKHYEPIEKNYKTRILYIQPEELKKPGSNGTQEDPYSNVINKDVIYLPQVYKHFEDSDDAFEKRFADSLKKWNKPPDGSRK